MEQPGAQTAGGVEHSGGVAVHRPEHIPSGVAVDTAGNVYVTDYGNYRVLELTTD